MMARRTWCWELCVSVAAELFHFAFEGGSNMLVRNALQLLATKVLGTPFHCESFWSAQGLLSSSGTFSTAAGLPSPPALGADQELCGRSGRGMVPQLYWALLACLASAQSRLATVNRHGFVMGGKCQWQISRVCIHIACLIQRGALLCSVWTARGKSKKAPELWRNLSFSPSNVFF